MILSKVMFLKQKALRNILINKSSNGIIILANIVTDTYLFHCKLHLT